MVQKIKELESWATNMQELKMACHRRGRIWCKLGRHSIGGTNGLNSSLQEVARGGNLNCDNAFPF